MPALRFSRLRRLFEQFGMVDQFRRRGHADPFGDLPSTTGIGFGVDAGDVEDVFASANAQESGGLLESLGTDSGDGVLSWTRERNLPFSLRNSTIFCAVRSVMPAT